MNKFKKGDILVPNGTMKQNYSILLKDIKRVEVSVMYRNTMTCKILEGVGKGVDCYTNTIGRGRSLTLRPNAFKLENPLPSYEIF